MDDKSDTKKDPPESGYLVITFGYNKFIIPYKEGMEIVNACQYGECIAGDTFSGSTNPERVVPLGSNDGFEISFSVVSGSRYRQLKANTLLTENPDQP